MTSACVPDDRPLTISITEDDPAVRDVLELILSRAGYNTIIHTSPLAALAAANSIPDLFIIDRQLSGIDGLDLCRKIRTAPATSDVPVLIISATPHVARLAAGAGAHGFLEKPFRSGELLDLIRECLSIQGKK